MSFEGPRSSVAAVMHEDFRLKEWRGVELRAAMLKEATPPQSPPKTR